MHTIVSRRIRWLPFVRFMLPINHNSCTKYKLNSDQKFLNAQERQLITILNNVLELEMNIPVFTYFDNSK